MSPAPAALGRGAIVGAGDPAPDGWADAERVEVGPDVIADEAGAQAAVESLRSHWARRRPVVVELGVDPARFRAPVAITEPPYSLPPDLDLPFEMLHHLVWANNYDLRSGEPVWWWAQKAARHGAQVGGDADVRLVDGRAAWIDGGPRWSCPELEPAVVHSSSVEIGSLEPVGGGGGEGPIDLAPDQRAAVAHPGGAVRVIAPAGSGKTRVLTERIRYLLGERGYDRELLLAVAYNKEAQRELEARLFKLQPRTRTLNSLGYRIVREHRERRPPLLDELEVRRTIEEVFPIPRQRRTNTDPVGPYIDALTQVRLGLRSPAEVEAERDDVTGLADGFDAYRERLLGRGAVDFDEQIYGALEALLADGRFRRRMQATHRHLLVDEFQDLTPAHVLLIGLLAMPTLDVFGVGDDDQTIYDHAGADPRFLVDYAEIFPGAEATALEVNYRCAEPIVRGAATLLGYNELRVQKRIRAAEGADADPGALEIVEHPGGEAAERAARVVSSWRGDDAVEAGEIAVLARVNSLLLAPQIALWSAGVPLHTSVGPELLERAGVAAALAWLRVAVDPEGLIPADLELIRRRPSRGFPRWISKWFVNCRSVADLRGAERAIDDERIATKVADLADDIELLAGIARGGATTRELLLGVRDRIGLGGAMEMLDGSKGGQNAASHLDDLEGLIQVSDLHTDPNTFEPWLRAALAESKGNDGVTLSTVHRVKGREWDRVVVFGVNRGLLPHRLSENWEAERRVLHVAVTRARERCVLLADDERPSPFLAELTGEAERGAKAPPKASPAAGGKRAAARPPLAVDPKPESPAADEALRRWRTERSTADKVPAYVVLSNRQLEGIAATMPTDSRELLACEGIGPSRLERYGDDILAVLDSVRA
ncbi:MAG TPA: ATP-dependent DNA helicase UvrD2 [Solirubrobacterales bacterium]|nr:ATP-dependent DNA helicase UvrD2 [Solirubrobacterales bacterium]